MASWRPGYVATPVACRSGDNRPAEYDLMVYRNGSLKSVTRNLCRRCAHRQGDGAITHADFVDVRLIGEGR